jgi:8-oxo-dGTP pyrophosphatase MutT (NUDIX family)
MDSRLEVFVRLLGQDEPIERVERRTAAVAAIFRSSSRGEEVLLIKRADRAGDPWSGDVALPGGRVEAEDSSFMETAAREALEEVGADLSAGARFLGYMRPFQARRRSILVVPCVFIAAGPLSIAGSSEVSSHMWVPVSDLMEPKNRSTYDSGLGGEARSFPAFSLSGYTVWGLTERILSSIVDSLQKQNEHSTSKRSP